MAVCFWDTPFKLQMADFKLAHLKSSTQWSLDWFFRGLNAHVKTGFILITSWNFNPYRLPQLGDNLMEMQPKRTRVRPRLVQRYGMFVCHTFNLALMMPLTRGSRHFSA
jgi:hypothetical protein